MGGGGGRRGRSSVELRSAARIPFLADVGSCDQFLAATVVKPRRRPGFDVMITIFCDFRKFSAKKLAFFSKTNVMINFFQYFALF
jgi:hypothetical protein